MVLKGGWRGILNTLKFTPIITKKGVIWFKIGAIAWF